MGELADRYWSDVVMRGAANSDQLNRWAATRDRIAALESIECIYDGLSTRNDQLHAQLNDIADVEKLSARLAAAERKAEQAWAAVTLMAARDEACIGVGHGAPVTMRYANPADHVTTWDIPSHVTYDPIHCVTVVFAVNAPANPDLLERHATLPIEAGEEMLKRYEGGQPANPSPPPVVDGGG